MPYCVVMGKKSGLCGRSLTHITTQCRILMRWRYIAVENIVRKGETACNNQFLLFSQCSLPYMTLISHFNPFTHNDTFWRPREKSLFKTLWEKEKLHAHNEQFLLFPQCFLRVWITFFHFCQIWNCSSANFFSLKESKICCLVID